ncbi:hypothetical protein ACFQ9X_21920 [Catenulispora yoronensis]
MNRPDWHRIGAGAEGDLVLAVDVDGTARSEATFHDLAPLLARNHDVRLTTLPDDLPDGPGEPSLEWFVDGWAHAMGAWAPRVEAVFGYCSGSLFALALADRMEDGYGVRPRVVLFDPERPTAATFLDDFTATVQAMSALTADERDSHVRRARRATEGEPDLEQVTEILATAYGEACGANLERLGIAADIGVELELAFAAMAATCSAPPRSRTTACAGATPRCCSRPAPPRTASTAGTCGSTRRARTCCGARPRPRRSAVC